MKRSLSWLKAPFFRVTSFILGAVFAAGLVTMMTVKAVDDLGVFEIGFDEPSAAEANILKDGALPDWATYFDANGNPVMTADDPPVPLYEKDGFEAFAFIKDDISIGNNVDRTVFAQSNKNNDLPETWNWDTGNVPPKTDLVNIYYLARLVPFEDDEENPMHLVIYIATERLKNDGVTHIDNEFNAVAHGLDKNPACGDDGVLPGAPGVTDAALDGAPCEFTGKRSVGDFHVTMDFVKGGGIGNVEIREWNGSDYVFVNNLDHVGCNVASGDLAADSICAFNNTAPVKAGPWGSYDDHGNVIPPGGLIATNLFTEMVVDVTGVLGRTPCVGSVLSKTRSSPGSDDTFNAELKDFGLDSFPLCSIEVIKDGDELSKIGDIADYDYTIKNTGVATVYLQSLIDVFDIGDGLKVDLTAKAAANGCSELAPQGMVPDDQCMFTVPTKIPEGSPDPLTNTVTATYNDVKAGTGVNLTDKDDHSINLFQPDYEVEKLCPVGVTAANPWYVGQPLSFQFRIKNLSSEDSPKLVLETLTDALLGDGVVTDAAKLAGADELSYNEEVKFSVSYTPTPADATTGYVVNSFATLYKPSGFPNELNRDDATDECPVVQRVPAIETQVHADLEEPEGVPDGGPHEIVTGDQIPSVTSIVHDWAKVWDKTAADKGITAVPLTGNLVFHLYESTDCDPATETTAFGYPKTIALGGATDPQEIETPDFALPVGPLGWRVEFFSADGTYASLTLENGGAHACEPVQGLQRDTVTVTYIHEGQPNAGHSGDPVSIDIQGDTVFVGTTVHDSAVVSQDPVIDSLVPTGTVDFLFFNTLADCEALTVSGSESDVALANAFAESSSYTITTKGDGELAYRAIFNPDDQNFNGSTSACEPLYIKLNGSKVETEVYDAAGNIVSYDKNGGVAIPIGTVIHDRAWVTGLDLKPYDPTGSVVFNLYSGTECAGEPIKTSTVALNDDGTNDAMTEARTNDVPEANPVIEITTVSGDMFSFRASYSGDDVYAAALDSRCEPVVVEEGAEGCTPGYWKQEHHFGSWVGYTPNQLYSAVFGVGPAWTLLQALEAQGNSSTLHEAFLRHSTAALLNAASDISYGLDTADVIAKVQAAYAVGNFDEVKDYFAGLNERGCPLGRAEAIQTGAIF